MPAGGTRSSIRIGGGGAPTRGGNSKMSQTEQNQLRMAKRKAEELLQVQQNKAAKRRPALGEITNALQETTTQAKKGLSKMLHKSKTTKTTQPQEIKQNIEKPDARLKKSKSVQDNKNNEEDRVNKEEVDSEIVFMTRSLPSSQQKTNDEDIVLLVESDSDEFATAIEEGLEEEEQDDVVPPGVLDFDFVNKDDPLQGGSYVKDIFNYYKHRETVFRVVNYMAKNQNQITTAMRTILVDWMVEVQESFELNHETLYTGVKMIDLYLSKMKNVNKGELQLCGATALLIACKTDERIPPLLDDFVYVCDDAYTKDQIVKKEIDMINVVDFDFGYPLTYRFLRRYGRVCQCSMQVLTFARYILEMSLMVYELNVETSESQLATATMALAMTIMRLDGWQTTLEYYSGYKLGDVSQLIDRLHKMLLAPPHESRNTIKTKYSHSVFHKVALTKIPKAL